MLAENLENGSQQRRGTEVRTTQERDGAVAYGAEKAAVSGLVSLDALLNQLDAG